MIVIIEGQDRCGKSTLIGQLTENYPLSFRTHSSKPPKHRDPYEFERTYYTGMADTAVQSRLSSFHDRFHLGVYVYGTQYRKYTEAKSIELIEDVEKRLSIGNTYLILLTDSGKNIMSRDDSGSFERSVEQYDTSRSKFIEAYNLSTLKKIHIDLSETGGFKNTLGIVRNFLEK